MTATMVIKEANGAGPTLTTITSGRYCANDLAQPGDTYPCVVPASSFYYSYWKHQCISWSGVYSHIQNIRWFTSGNVASNWNLGTLGKLRVGIKSTGDNGCPTASYMQATGTPGTSGTDMDDGTSGHTYYKQGSSNYAAPGNADSYTSAAPLTVDTTDYTSDNQSKYVVTQVMIASNATQGDKPNETFTFRYDEI